MKGDLSEELLDILLPSLFRAVIVSVGVISDSGDACISGNSELFRCAVWKTKVQGSPGALFAEEIVSSKVSKIAKLKAKCALYLSQCFEVGLVGSSTRNLSQISRVSRLRKR